MKSTLRKITKTSKKLGNRFSIHLNDLKNKLRYGIHAPKYMERIWIDPLKVTSLIGKKEVFDVTGARGADASATVVNWDEIQNIRPLSDQFRIQYCFKHWKEGKTWEEIGVIEYMTTTKKYGEWDKADIKKRFELLDRAFQETKNLGRLKTRKELNSKAFREEEGILIHIAKNGEPVFGGSGFHRMAIAQVLELKKIPACVGLVDKDAISHLKELRKPPVMK